MSGPKVVRVVTREELIQRCRSHLARLDAALSHWERVGIRNACLDESAIAAAKARRDELWSMLTKDRFVDIQKQVPVEIAFLQSDMEVRQTAAAAERAAVRTRQRRRGEAAGALLSALRNMGKPIDAALERSLERAARGDRDDGAMAVGFRILAQAQEGGSRSEERRAHAARLKEGESAALSLEDWLSRNAPHGTDGTQERLESRLATLAQLGPAVDLSSWEVRIDEAFREPDLPRRRLLLDGLEVDIGRATAKAKAVLQSRDRLRLLIAEMSAAGLPDLEEYVSILESAASVVTLDEATSKGVAAIETYRSAQAAAARRAAVLEGLAGLGYEVTEGMATAWVDKGRVVLRKVAQPEYGVEVTGNGEAGRLQLRAIALTNGNVGPDPSRDADIETLWCGDVAQLSQHLDREGGQLAIERALPVGATPLKRIEFSETDASHVSREGPAPKARRLP